MLPSIGILLLLLIGFVLLWWAIGYLPLPANFPPWFKSLLYFVLIVVAAVIVLGWAGVHV